jgi:16S rRNA (uracil1498-N3)-methyltransferase
MNLFYGTPLTEDVAFLTEEESGHCIRVMRKKTGDEIFFTDGAGNLYSGTITVPDPKKCEVRILKTSPGYGKRNYSLHVAIAPTKNIDRFEWFLEKATEIGIDEITPVICERSERRIVKTERLNKVILSAMKQSLKAWLPKLHEPVPLEKLMSGHSSVNKFICTQDAAEHLEKKIMPSENNLVLVGPEGDFTEDEILLCSKNNFIPVSLGQSRLRTETAGIVVCSVVSLRNRS